MAIPDPSPNPDTPITPGMDAVVEKDALEAILPAIPIVLPIAGGVLMFLLAFIAITMA